VALIKTDFDEGSQAGLWLTGGGIWSCVKECLGLAGGGIWPCVKVGLGLGGFMAGWGWYLALCEGGFWPGWVYGWLGVVFGPV
jgi:hypothetical protein